VSASHVLSGLVVPGDGRGTGLGFPTANIACDTGDLPEDGIYAAWVHVDDDASRRGSTVSVGSNPTFDGERDRRVEVYLHDVDLDLYGRRLTVRFLTRLRPTLCFDGVDELVAQSEKDVQQSRRVLAQS
jgi:riboflavin kinase/FMN adenylyltransferase